MKRTHALLLALALLAAAVLLLWPRHPTEHKPLLDESIQFTTELLPKPTPSFEGDHWTGLNYNGDFSSLMEDSTVALLGEVTEVLYVDPWSTYCFIVKVLTDYYGNIDYRGMEEPGCIWVCWSAMHLWEEDGSPFLKEGGRYFFFLTANHNLSYRQMIYLPTTDFAPQPAADGLLFPRHYRELGEHGVQPFGISEQDDLDRRLREYVAALAPEKVPRIRAIPEMRSYEEAYRYALTVQLIEVTDWQERPWGSAVVYYNILENLKTIPSDPVDGRDYEPPTKDGERVPDDLTFEIGKRYLLFKGQDPRYDFRQITILSMDCGFLPEDHPLFERYCRELRAG